MLNYTTWLVSKMDHVKYIFENPALTGQIARWQVLLSEFDIVYVTQKEIKGSALGLGLQLILQWLTGILVLICCFVEKKKFSVDISSKLGSSFSLVPFVIVVVSILHTFLVLLN